MEMHVVRRATDVPNTLVYLDILSRVVDRHESLQYKYSGDVAC